MKLKGKVAVVTVPVRVSEKISRINMPKKAQRFWPWQDEPKGSGSLRKAQKA